MDHDFLVVRASAARHGLIGRLVERVQVSVLGTSVVKGPLLVQYILLLLRNLYFVSWLQIRVDFNGFPESLALVIGIAIFDFLPLTKAASFSRLRHGLLVQLQVFVPLLNAFALQEFLAFIIWNAFLLILHLLQLLFDIGQIARIH